LEVRGLVESVLDTSPVDDLPNVGQVVRSEVLVLKVVGMFPDIDGEERDEALGLNLVLVGSLLDGQTVGHWAVGEPAPARTLDGGSLLIELLHEVIVAAEALLS